MNYFITLKKGVLGFATGLAATVVLAVAASLTNYNPVVCSATVTENCTPQFIVAGYMMIIPALTGVLTALANWLKNRDK